MLAAGVNFDNSYTFIDFGALFQQSGYKFCKLHTPAPFLPRWTHACKLMVDSQSSHLVSQLLVMSIPKLSRSGYFSGLGTNTFHVWVTTTWIFVVGYTGGGVTRTYYYYLQMYTLRITEKLFYLLIQISVPYFKSLDSLSGTNKVDSFIKFDTCETISLFIVSFHQP